MRCRNCGNPVDGRWAFCPFCGAPIEKPMLQFGRIFEQFAKEMNRMQKMIGSTTPRTFEAFDLKPMFAKPKPNPGRSGFSISIKRALGKKPEVNVKTYGKVNQKVIEGQLKSLGVQPGSIVKVGTKGRAMKRPKPRSREMPEVTEEPHTKIEKKGRTIHVEMKLPGVKSENDIEIQRLPQSIEIRAYSDKKGYFKILSVTPTSRIRRTAFKKGRLILEIEE